MTELSHSEYAFGTLNMGDLPGGDAPEFSQLLPALATSAAPIVVLLADYTVSFANTAMCRMGMLAANVNPVGQAFETTFPALHGPDMRSTLSRLSWYKSVSGGWFGLGTDALRPGAMSRANTDELTGLGNRRYLRTFTQELLQKTTSSLVLIAIDLDNFKEINDTLGHSAGDHLLQKAAQRMKNAVRTHDTVIRMGGDEFVVIIQHPERDILPEAIADRIIRYLSRPFTLNSQQMQVGASIGIALTHEGEREIAGALRRADIALYASKAAGRGQWRWYAEEMSQKLNFRRELETGLRQAIRQDELVLHYQPQIVLEGDAIRAFEALVRWDHPTRGLLLPNDFLPIAETSGLIHDLGAWVLRHACLAATLWPENIKVSVNISAFQLQHKDFVRLIEDTLEITGLPAHRLELEVKETALVHHDRTILEQMVRLKSMGIALSLEEFGSSYSNLHALQHFEFDQIKIDHSYVRHNENSNRGQDLLTSITQLGLNFGQGVLAEGVETRGQLSAVRRGGAGSIQGYLYARPLEAAEIQAFLENPPKL